MTAALTLQDLKENFSTLSEWEERYRYIIELGRYLPHFPLKDQIPAHQVEGCISQVWLLMGRKGEHYTFLMESDSAIVKGLLAILMTLVNNKTGPEIKALNLRSIFKDLGLADNLTPQRRRGLDAVIHRLENVS